MFNSYTDRENKYDHDSPIQPSALRDAQASREPLQPCVQVLLLSGKAETLSAGQVEGN